jgi:hypothetical protein
MHRGAESLAHAATAVVRGAEGEEAAGGGGKIHLSARDDAELANLFKLNTVLTKVSRAKKRAYNIAIGQTARRPADDYGAAEHAVVRLTAALRWPASVPRSAIAAAVAMTIAIAAPRSLAHTSPSPPRARSPIPHHRRPALSHSRLTRVPPHSLTRRGSGCAALICLEPHQRARG